MIRLVALDIDGTLLDGRGRVPAANVRALAEAASRGIHLVVVTGRNYPFALPAVQQLPDPLTLVVYNGAVARIRDGATIAAHPLAARTARRILESTRRWRDATTVQFDRVGAGQTLFDALSWDHPNRRSYYDKIQHHALQVADLELALEGDDPVQVAFNGSTTAMRELLDVLAGVPDADGVTVAATHYTRRDFSLVDVNARGATKGAALAVVASHFGVARDEVFAIGDNHNDIDMLEWAGTGVVMGNAEPDLLALGLPITDTNERAGLARALAKYVLL